MIVNGVNAMTAEERAEIVELLVKNGFHRSLLATCTDKQVADELRQFRAESKKGRVR